MFDITNFTLASAVAASGTVTVGYATDRSQGDYDWSSGKHVLFVNGNKLSAPADFTLTFNVNASSITLTNATSGTWAAGATMQLQVDRNGQNDAKLSLADTNRVRQTLTGLYLLNLGSPNVADADGAAASQTVTGAGTAFVLNGALVVGSEAVFDVPRAVVAAWTNTAIITIIGKDEYGVTVQEKSASGTSHTGKKAFKKITSITTNATITGATVGTGDVLGLPVFLRHLGQIIAEFKNGQLLPRTAGRVFIPWELEQTQLLAPTNEMIVCPVAGTISRLRGIVQAAVTTGGTITVNVNTVAVAGLTFTVADADAAGTRYSDTPTAGDATTVVAAGDKIEIVPSAPFATAGELNGILEIETTTTGQLNGTAVVGVQSKATATTGDVRGTYDPVDAMDGDVGVMLLVALTDGDFKGVTQFAG